MTEEVSSETISEVALQIFSADEVEKMSDGSAAKAARRVEWMLEGRDRVRPEDIERDPSVTGADGATSRARAIAEQLSGLSRLGCRSRSNCSKNQPLETAP